MKFLILVLEALEIIDGNCITWFTVVKWMYQFN